MLTPTVVNQSSAPAANSARKNTDLQNNPDSFGQVLHRSLAGNDGSTDKASEKKTEPAPERPSARRLAARAGTDQQPDQNAALGLALMPIDGKPANVAADNPQPCLGKPLPTSADSQLNQALAAAIGTTGAAAVSRVDTDLQPAADKPDPVPTRDTGMDPATQPAGISSAANPRLTVSAQTEPGQATLNATDGHTSLAPGAIAAEAMIAQRASTNGGGNRESQPGDSGSNASEQFKVAASTAIMPPAPAVQLPPAMAGIDTSATTPVPLPLTPAVGSSEWAGALGKQVLWMGNDHQAQAELHLNPPDLGPLKVALSFNDNQAQALFVAAHQSVRAAIEAALPQLRAALADNGISLGNTSVSADTRHQQPGASAQHQGNQSSQPNYRSADLAAPAQPATTERPTAAATRSAKRSAIDTFA